MSLSCPAVRLFYKLHLSPFPAHHHHHHHWTHATQRRRTREQQFQFTTNNFMRAQHASPLSVHLPVPPEFTTALSRRTSTGPTGGPNRINPGQLLALRGEWNSCRFAFRFFTSLLSLDGGDSVQHPLTSIRTFVAGRG